MSDQEVTLRITGKNESQPATDQARDGLRALNAEADKTSAKTKDASVSTDQFAASWQTAAIGAVAAGGASLAVLTLQAMSSAAGLTDLRTKTGLSLEELQRLDYVARLTGQGVDVYANAVYRMGINVEQGSEKAKAGVERMGMSWEAFRSLSPEKQLQAIIAHLDFTNDAQERNATLAAIFGRSIDNVLVGLVQHYGTAQDAALVSSDGMIEALARYDAKIKETQATLGQMVTLGAGGLLILAEKATAGWGGFADVLGDVATNGVQGAAMLAVLEDMTRRQQPAITGLSAAHKKYVDDVFLAKGATTILSNEFLLVTDFMGASRTEVEAYAKSLADKAAPAQRDYVKELRDAKAALADLDPATRAQLAAAAAGTESTKELAAAFGLSEVAIKVFKDGLRDTEQQQKKAEIEARKYREALTEIASATVSLTTTQREEILALKDRSVSEAAIATALKITATQVRQVIDQEKDRIEVAKDSDKVMAESAKLRRQEAQRVREETQQAGLERLKMETDLHDTLVRFDHEQSVRGLQGVERELASIRVSEDAAIAAARRKYGTNIDLAEREIATIRVTHQQMRDLAVGTADTAIERAVAQGFATTKMLRESADAAKRAYDEMRASGQFSIDELNRKRDEWLAKELAAAGAMSGLWQKAFAGLPAVILGALAGGGDVGRAIGAHVGAQLADELGKRAAEDLIKAGHTKLAGAVTSLMGPLGTLAGNVFAGALDKVFGSKGRDAVKTFAESMGGFDELRAKLLPLGDEGERLWKNLTQGVGKNNPEQAKAAIEAVTKAIALQESALRKYDVQWFDLGGTARAAGLAELIEELTREQEALTWAGLSSEGALKKQAKAYNDLLTEAMRTGQAIPPALLPTVLRLAEMGELTEANTRLLLGMAEDTRPGLKELEDAASTLGIKVSDLGTRYDQLKFDDATDRYMKAFETLAAGGMDVHEAISKMSDETIEAIAAGVRLGREFPEGMRPVLQAMLEQGRLTDENGEKLTSLSGVSFAESLTAKMGSVIDKIQEMIDALLGIPNAMNQIPRSLDVDVNFRASRHGEWYEGGGDGVVVEPFASGGVAEGPMYAQIEPGRKEIIGDVDFIGRAIDLAMQRRGSSPAALAGGTGQGEITILMPIYLGTEEIDRRIVRVGQDALEGQLWQVPQTVLAARPRF